MSTLRRLAVGEGRAMIRVRRRKTGELATAGVCPACWNIRERRRDLLTQLDKMGLEVAHREDLLEGTYRLGRQHAPGCRHAGIHPDPWKRFEDQVRRQKE
jgi:hypothetical protein